MGGDTGARLPDFLSKTAARQFLLQQRTGGQSDQRMEGAKYEGQRDEKRAETGLRGVVPATDVPKHEQQRDAPTKGDRREGAAERVETR